MNEGGPWEKYRESPPPETGGSGGPWEKYGGAATADVPAPPPAAGIDWADIGKGAVSGVESGVTGLAGTPGNIGNFVRAGAERVLPQNIVDTAARSMRGNPLTAAFTGPDSAEIQRAVEPYTGAFYQPTSKLGKFARTGTEFGTAALLPGSGMTRAAASVPKVIAARTLNTVAPAVASETAGQLTENTPYEPYARAIGGIAGGVTAAKAISPQAVLPQFSDVGKALVSAGAGAAMHTMGAGPIATVASIIAPYAADKLMRTAPVQGYLANQALPQSARDIITQTLVQQGLSQPSGIERNQAGRADAAKHYESERRARGFD